MSKQSDVYERIVEALIDLEDVFVKPQDYRLTFIVRNVKESSRARPRQWRGRRQPR